MRLPGKVRKKVTGLDVRHDHAPAGAQTVTASSHRVRVDPIPVFERTGIKAVMVEQLEALAFSVILLQTGEISTHDRQGDIHYVPSDAILDLHIASPR